MEQVPIKHVPAERLTPDLVRWVEQTKHIRDLFLVYSEPIFSVPRPDNILDNLYGTPSLSPDSGRINLVSPFLNRV